MCEFVCQISILISVAAIVQEKSFSVETIATRLTGRRQPARGGGGGHPHTSTTPKSSGGGAWVLLQTSAVLWSQVGARDSFRKPSRPLLSSSLGRTHSCPSCSVAPHGGRLPAPGAWSEASQPSQARGPSRPAQPVDPPLRRQSSARMGVSPASEEMPRKCQARDEPRSRTFFQGPSQLQRQLLHIPETEMAIGSHHRKRGERMSVG